MNASSNSSRLVGASIALFSFVYLATADVAVAGPIKSDQLPSISVQIGDDPTNEQNRWDYSAPVDAYRDTKKGGYELHSSEEFNILDDRATVEIRAIEFNPDPFVLNNLLVTNNTMMTQTFSATVSLGTVFPAPNLISGNVRTSVIDGGSDGATLATSAPTSIYQAQIDSGTVATLQDHAFSVVAPAGSSDTMAASFGPSFSAIPVTTDIGIMLKFTLTAGDTAAILSRFDVVAVPEPASLALCLLGFFAASVATRRPLLR